MRTYYVKGIDMGPGGIKNLLEMAVDLLNRVRGHDTKGYTPLNGNCATSA